MSTRIALFSCVVLACLAGGASAHDPVTSSGEQQWSAALGATLLAAFWLVYLVGAWCRPPRWSQAAGYHGAMLLCVLAVFGPLDTWAETDAAAHMSQHMLLMVVIAPLWVASRPLPQLRAGGFGHAQRWLWQPLLPLTRHPLWAAWLHGGVIWFWHMPRFYVLALESPWWHVIEHACFLLTAMLFWWAVLKSTRQAAPWALLAVLFTLMHTGFLGALLTFAPAPLYVPVPTDLPQQLAAQQLAGLLMWVVGGTPYLLAAIWIMQRWYRQLTRRMAHDADPLRTPLPGPHR